MPWKHIAHSCPQCDRRFFGPPTAKFCGHRCALNFHQAKVGSASKMPAARAKNADARRGRGKGNGYVKRGGRHEHRVVAEQKLGRPLRPDEVAHHRDEMKRNNAPNNIDVMTRVAHGRLHNLGATRRKKTHCKNGHALAGDNVAMNTSGKRRCITCSRAYQNRWQKQRRASARIGAPV